MVVPKFIEGMSKEKIVERYESNLVSVLEAIDKAGTKIAGRAGEVFLREIGYALSDVGFKTLPKFDKVEDAGKHLEKLWAKLGTVGELKIESIEEKKGYTEMVISFRESNCILTVNRKTLERGACPLCRFSLYFMERNLSRLLDRHVHASYLKYDEKTGKCYEIYKIYKHR